MATNSVQRLQQAAETATAPACTPQHDCGHQAASATQNECVADRPSANNPTIVCGQSTLTSDAAHQQYTYFKCNRQQRHAAAVTLQRHARGMLARLMAHQLQKLRQHAMHRQQHVQLCILLLWHKHAIMRSNMR